MIAVFSDLHGNAGALKEALPKIKKAEAVVCLGDTVGYRRNPEEAIRLVRDLSDIALLGNHDAAATGQLDSFLEGLPSWLLATLEDTHSVPADLFEWLASRRPAATFLGMQLTHGTLRDPLLEFLRPGEAAESHLQMQTAKISLAGHTHQPLAISKDKIFFPSREAPELILEGGPWALNPGSLGIKKSGQSWMEIDGGIARWHFL